MTKSMKKIGSPSDNPYRSPTIIIPYAGHCPSLNCQDVFVYLRPETNGVRVESTIFRVIRSNPEYKDRISLCYLANIPGDFITHHKIVEEHYGAKIFFTHHGKAAFTEDMKRQFEEYFRVSFENGDILGAFEALDVLGLSYEDLFRLRVPKEHMLIISGQTLKLIDGHFVINYDIPAILHKNNNDTDIAVMIFRTNLSYTMIHGMIADMGKALVDENILNPDRPLSRIFHYSKGPFEQVLDAIGYLYKGDGTHVPLEQITFCAYLMNKGLALDEILHIIKNPIMKFSSPGAESTEEDIFSYTKDMSFDEAYNAYRNIVWQYVIR